MTSTIHILLVEDSPSDADLLQHSLQGTGLGRFEFAWVERLSDAIERASRESFDVALLDLSLPDSSGPDTFRRLQKAAPALPVVLLTGLSDEKLGLTAVHEGVQDYLTKTQTDGRQVARAIRYAVERKRAEEELRRHQQALMRAKEDLNRAQAVAHTGSWRLKAATNELFWSDETYRIFGITRDTPLTFDAFMACVHPLDRELVDRSWKAAARGEPYDIEHRIVVDGHVKWVRERAHPEFDSGGVILGGLGTVQDITGRKHTEEKIRHQNAVLQGINRILREALACDSEEDLGRVCLAVAEEVTGSRFGFLAEVNAEQRFNVIAITDPGWEACRIPLADGRLPSFEMRGVYGRAVLKGEGFFTNDPGSEPDSVGLPEGHPPLSSFLGVPLKHEGRVIGLLALANREGGYRPQDVEGMEALALSVVQVFMRKRAERALRAGEERLREAQKMESIAVLAGGVAHDFNNLLVGVLGSASLAIDMLPKGSPAEDLLHAIIRSGEQAAHLTSQMLAYSGKGQFVVGPVDLSDVIREVTDLVRSTAPKKAEIQLDLEPGLPPVEADRSQIHQVLMNLVINATEAMGDQAGLVTVRTGNHLVDERFIRESENAEISPGRYVFLEVRDNGCGMDEATKARIFDPFFTTKFQGRGLGLAAVAGIVRGHKGAIQVRTAPGRGTTFTLLFPALDAKIAPPAAQHRREGEQHLRTKGTVLLVDDEETVRNTARLALETRGCNVMVASSGVEAIALLEQNADEIPVAILDLSMPGMSGQEVLPKLLAISPGLAVVVSSGYAEDDAMRRFAGMPVAGFIQKPYTARRLVDRVQTILDRK